MDTTSARRYTVIWVWVMTTVLATIAIVLSIVNVLDGDKTFTPHALMGPGYATVGAVILMRRHHRIGALFLAFGLFSAVLGAQIQSCSWLGSGSATFTFCAERLPIGDILWPASYAFFGSLLLLFPTGGLPSKRWIAIATVFGSSWGILIIGAAFRVEGPIVAAANSAAVFSLIAVAAAPLVRIRTASPLEKVQLRYLAYVLATSIAGTVAGLVLHAIGLDEAAGPVIGLTMLAVAAVGIPVAIGLAILRYRLYDIDLLINRTLVYGLLSAVLAGVYVGIVFTLQAVLAPVTAESDLAVAASTLAVAALFRPARGAVQRLIDRSFYRSRFDVQETLESFGAKVRDEVDLASLREGLERVVVDTMQPAHVSLWLKVSRS